MRSLRQAGAALALLLVVSSVASAQARGAAANRPKPLEFGTDAAFSLGLDDPSTTQIMIPTGNFRVGIHTSPNLSIEPFADINYIKVEGFDGLTTYTFGVGGLYHFSVDRTKSQMYVRPFASLIGFSGATSDSEIGVGVGLGMKFTPKWNGRFQWRGEANIFSINDATSINLLWGVSIYPR